MSRVESNLLKLSNRRRAFLVHFYLGIFITTTDKQGEERPGDNVCIISEVGTGVDLDGAGGSGEYYQLQTVDDVIVTLYHHKKQQQQQGGWVVGREVLGGFHNHENRTATAGDASLLLLLLPLDQYYMPLECTREVRSEREFFPGRSVMSLGRLYGECLDKDNRRCCFYKG